VECREILRPDAGPLPAVTYLLGLRNENEPLSFPVAGMEGGSISMLAVRIG
jgi:hypothetical protein